MEQTHLYKISKKNITHKLNFEPRVKLLTTRVSANLDSNEFDVIITYEIIGIDAQAQQLSFTLQQTR